MLSVDPTTGEVIATWPTHPPEEVQRRLDAARSAQRAWRETSFAERAVVLEAIADRLEAEAADHAPAMSLEMGKPVTESEGELRKCAWVCRYYAEQAEGFCAPEVVDVGSTDTRVRFDPLGVVLAVMPWNFPWWQVFRFAAPALMAGNGLLVKHAPNTQDVAARIERLCLAAGLPQGLLATLVIDEEDVAGVIADRRVAAVTLTGSDRAGRAVASTAGAHLKKAVLELGGSDPFIVLADADLELAVAQGVRSRCLNNGQSCIAAKRFLVEEPVLEEFTDRLVAAMDALVVGDPQDRATQLGPLARGDLRDLLVGQVVRSVEAGARRRLGGQRPEGPGFFYPATVLDRLDPSMAAMREETFGPVAALMGVASADDALAIANASPLGLGAAIFTADLDRARSMARRLEVGCVFVNRMTASDPRVPFGGVKDSGYGRELGIFGIREFVNVKTVWVG